LALSDWYYFFFDSYLPPNNFFPRQIGELQESDVSVFMGGADHQFEKEQGELADLVAGLALL
jgi:hypothetical protein